MDKNYNRWKWGNNTGQRNEDETRHMVKEWKIVHIYSMVTFKEMAAGQTELWKSQRNITQTQEYFNSMQCRHFLNFKLPLPFLLSYHTVKLSLGVWFCES